MKMGRTLGVVATGGILFGLWISGWLKGFGLGDSKFPGVQVSTQQTKVSDEDVDQTLSKTNASTALASSTESRPETQAAPQVLDIIIDDAGYHFRNSQTYAIEPAVIPLDQVIQQALLTTPSNEGPRVKIYRKASSRTSNEARLSAALAEAGLKPVDIYWHPAVTE